jgi:hypothetical protein
VCVSVCVNVCVCVCVCVHIITHLLHLPHTHYTYSLHTHTTQGGLKADMEIYNEARMKLWLKFDNERRKKITASTFAELELTSLMSAVYSE